MQVREGETRERLCETGTCESSRHSDGGFVRNAEGALLLASDQGQEEDLRINPVKNESKKTENASLFCVSESPYEWAKKRQILQVGE